MFFKNIANATDFAIIALNIQHNENGKQTGILRFEGETSWKSDTILNNDMSFNMSANTPIDLRGTGITGLTRDNSYDNTDFSKYLEYKSGKNTN